MKQTLNEIHNRMKDILDEVYTRGETDTQDETYTLDEVDTPKIQQGPLGQDESRGRNPLNLKP